MDEIKSALDRALERADRMGKLSAEEMKRQNEVTYQPIGTAIAQRFFEHGEPSILSEQLQRLEEEGRDIALKSALITMVRVIDIENRELSDRAVGGIIGLVDLNVIRETVDSIRMLFGQYAWQEKLLYEDNSEDLGMETRRKMAMAGISGAAIEGINMENDQVWAEKVQELRSEFDGKLDKIRQSLRKLLELS